MKLWKFSILILLAGCADNPPDPILQNATTVIEREEVETPHVIEISAFDVGNVENSSDIRVVFELDYVSVSKISEARIFISRSEFTDILDENSALALPSKKYHSIPIVGRDNQFSVRLDSIPDVDGNPIQNDVEYVIKILTIAHGFNELSMNSNTLTLMHQSIYAGYYEGTFLCQDSSWCSINGFVPVSGELQSCHECITHCSCIIGDVTSIPTDLDSLGGEKFNRNLEFVFNHDATIGFIFGGFGYVDTYHCRLRKEDL